MCLHLGAYHRGAAQVAVDIGRCEEESGLGLGENKDDARQFADGKDMRVENWNEKKS